MIFCFYSFKKLLVSSFLDKNFCFNSGKTKAFTLAEVLITLGIIGIVAAMTIPNLITTHQKKVTVTKLQKAISTLNQAYRMSYDEVGEPENAFELGAEKYFKEYWAPYIKVLTYCSTPESCGYRSNTPFVQANGTNRGFQLINKQNKSTFYSMDGFLYIVITGAGSTHGWVPYYEVVVDINGSKGPNKNGKDLFWLSRKDGTIRPKGYQYSDEQINNNCKKGSSGLYCAEKIRRSGWQITDNYPW